MPTIFICGDPHGRFEHIVDAARNERPMAVILLGDLELSAPLDIVFEKICDHSPVLWIPGNHDTEDEQAFDFLFNSKLASNNLHGRIVNIGGMRIAGLGGVFRSKVWTGAEATYGSPEEYVTRCGRGNLWRGGLPMRHRSTIFPSDVERLCDGSADILVTHEAPGAHKYGNVVLSELAQKLDVKAAFHGHHHESIRYPDGVWRGVGLGEVVRLAWSSPSACGGVRILSY